MQVRTHYHALCPVCTLPTLARTAVHTGKETLCRDLLMKGNDNITYVKLAMLMDSFRKLIGR